MPAASECLAFLKNNAKTWREVKNRIGQRTTFKSLGFCYLITKILNVLNLPVHSLYLVETCPSFSKSYNFKTSALKYYLTKIIQELMTSHPRD